MLYNDADGSQSIFTQACVIKLSSLKISIRRECPKPPFSHVKFDTKNNERFYYKKMTPTRKRVEKLQTS
jgi:hypothetical protein